MDGNNRILIVDDDADIRTVARLSLTRIGGYIVTEASSGMEALALMSGQQFDAVLLDVSMPDGDGPSYLSAMMRRRTPGRTAILLFTARVLPEERVALDGLGADGFVEKPFDPVALPSMIRAVLESRDPEFGPFDSTGEEMLSVGLESLWQTHRLSLMDDIDEVEGFVTDFGSHDQTRSRTAREAVHRLCGAFGVYGRERASTVAAELDLILRRGVAGPSAQERAISLLGELRNEISGV